MSVCGNALLKNFRPYTNEKLASDYPCIIVRTPVERDNEASSGLLALAPAHCMIAGVHLYVAGMACEKIELAFSGRPLD